MLNFHSHGKLLLLGEYLVLDGALALSCPTQKGQSLAVETVSETDQPLLSWQSFDPNGRWFEGTFQQTSFHPITSTNAEVAQRLSALLQAVRTFNPAFWRNGESLAVKTTLDFPRNWGLGSSSTLIHAVAQWAKVDPMDLFFAWANGSGYDVAQAGTAHSITYRLQNKQADWQEVAFHPSFTEQLFFVYLNEKQNSSQQVHGYQALKKQANLPALTQAISKLTEQALKTTSLMDFEEILREHEQILAGLLQQPPVQQRLFSDYTKGVVKSLGAWGGDFVLATGDLEATDYFRQKGYQTIVPWKEMIYPQKTG